MPSPILTTHLPAHRALTVQRMVMDHRCPPHPPMMHDHGSLALVVRGEVTLCMDAAYALRRGDVFLIPEGMPHCMERRAVDGEPAAADAAEPLTLIGLSVCVPCLDDPGGRALARTFGEVSRGAAAVRRLAPEAIDPVEGWLTALGDELAAERPGHELAVGGLLALIATALIRASPVARAPGPRAGLPLVARALAHINEHALDGISLRDVAAAVGRAPAHLAAVVKAETGRTVVDWITHARMAFARQLLARSDETVDVIADRVGYASPSHFHRTFRRAHGLPPSAWRTLHREGPAP